MCAMMPMFRVFSSATERGINLPPVMCERFVRLLHGFFTARPRVSQNPTNAQGSSSSVVYFNRHLIGGTANAPRLHFQSRLNVLHGFLEKLQGIVVGIFLDDVEGAVENPLGGTLLPAVHHAIDELRDQRALKHRICTNLVFDDTRFPW